MSFIYHMRPIVMIGSILYPLNSMKVTLPEVYSSNLQRYQGREALMKERIAPLDCLWNDVLHFAPVDLKKVFSALQSAGQTPKAELKYFKVPIERVNGLDFVWYNYTPSSETAGFSTPERDFLKMTTSDYRELPDLPEATKDYYREVTRQGSNRTFLFHLCPHVLVKGPVDISACEVLSWDL